MLLLVVLQVRLGSLLWGAEAAEAVVVAGWCVAYSLVPALVLLYSLEATHAPLRPDQLLTTTISHHVSASGQVAASVSD